MDEELNIFDLNIVRAERIRQLLEVIDFDDFIYINDEIIQETTYRELERYTLNFRPKTKKRQYAIDPIQIVQLKLVPYKGTKALYIKGLARNTESKKKYDTQLFFSGIEYENEDTDSNVTFTASDENVYHMKPIDLGANDVRTRCNCLDYYHRFAYYNYNDGSIFGKKPKPYIRKTTNRPPVNPEHVPGICKHIIKTIAALHHAKMVKG